jgi:hypothetical protein
VWGTRFIRHRTYAISARNLRPVPLLPTTARTHHDRPCHAFLKYYWRYLEHLRATSLNQHVPPTPMSRSARPFARTRRVRCARKQQVPPPIPPLRYR